MRRNRKVFTAALILLLGCVLAWPFRKAEEPSAPNLESETQIETPRATNGDPIAAQSDPQVMAHMASASTQSDSAVTNNLESFDIANHPALAERVEDQAAPFSDGTPSPVVADPEPAYATSPSVNNPNLKGEWPRELVHVVANGDTLEKLAERYLHDAGRALEIFDINRDQLSNPHLLPIGVELRVPHEADRILD